jgi:hypothetical protein
MLSAFSSQLSAYSTPDRLFGVERAKRLKLRCNGNVVAA